jgi:hypothetical protein
LDKVEIERGQDPNCPIGKDCTGSLLTNPSAAATNSPEASAAVSGLISQPTVTSSGDIGLGSLLPADATSLRQVLLESGMDQAMLDQFSDEELLEAYQEAFK